MGHSEVSVICEMVLFGLACLLFPTAFAAMVMDTRECVKRRCSSNND